MTPRALLQDIAQRLRTRGIPDSAKEAELLVTSVLRISRPELYAFTEAVSPEASAAIETYALRRCAGEPLHYIIGYLEFMGLHISVGPGVLIPRPETELLAEETIRRIQEGGGRVQEGLAILDLCTGSGCIALSLAKAFPEATVFGVDISPSALSYARKNAADNAVGNISFVEGDLFAPFDGQAFTCVTANPPYIKASDVGNLQIEIRAYEPLSALVGGDDGLDFYRRILAEAPQHLQPDGLLIMELGYDQADAVGELARANGFSDILCIPDYAGIGRVFVGRKRSLR
jgi:release factor glutamine methyltransferase